MKQNKKRLTKRVSLALTLLVVMSILPLGTALADPNFVLDGFKTKWSRADKPVNDGTSSPARSWLWGPEGFNPASGTTEPYGDSPGGVRTVEYFDKARMELNNPANGLVTNGLLVRELISGKLATSDAGSTQRRAANDIPVAGDPSGNDGPTYFSFQKIASLNNDNPSPDRTGQTVTDTLSKDGTLGTNPALGSNIKYVYFDKDGLKHNIPDVFWTFMNQRGNVYVNGGLQTNQPVLGDNPVAPWLDAMGFPIADAYWGKVTVGGEVKDVLIQPFERRVVTYTSSNPPAFQVEMGNVGRHYYTWRYSASYDIPPVVTPPADTGPKVKSCADLPPTIANVPLKCGPAGMQFYIFKDAMGKGEKVSVTPVDPGGIPYGPVYFLATGDTGRFEGRVDTLTQYALGFWTYKVKGVTSGIEFNVYIWLDSPVTTPTLIFYPPTIKRGGDIVVLSLGLKPNSDVFVTIVYPTRETEKGRLGKIGLGGGYFFEFVTDALPNEESYYGVYQFSIEAGGTALTGTFTITK